MSDYDNEINSGMSETKKISNDIKIPKSWKELESENAQLREELEKARRVIAAYSTEDNGLAATIWLAAHPEEKP